MLQTAIEPKRIAVRDFQHNFVKHSQFAKQEPIVVTKFGEDQFIFADFNTYDLKIKKPQQKYLTSNLKFFGMHKDREDWKGKSATQITEELRKAAWYGK
mgnify:CR=1 FL=1